METFELSLRFFTTINQSLGFDENLFKDLLSAIPLFSDISLVFIDRSQMKIYNQQYRNKSLSTDILTFCDEKGSGELIVCPDLVIWGASLHKIPVKIRLWHLLVHGCTHLRNIDHESIKEAKIFQRYEKAMWSQLCLKDKSFQPWEWDKNYVYSYHLSRSKEESS